MTTQKPRSTFAPVRHPFLYEMQYPALDKFEVRKKFAKVRLAKKPVTMHLAEEHVLRSIKLGGVGNTAICSAAICTTQHADVFPHPVEGHIDFTYTRAFLVSKIDKIGLPVECYAYEHKHEDIARLNDTKGGQKKLLERIRRDGPIAITLTPYRQRSAPGRSGRGRVTTGRRTRVPAKGANLRYAVMKMGAYPSGG